MRVYRRRNERYADTFVHECDKFGGGAVMVWGGITLMDELLICSMRLRLQAVVNAKGGHPRD